jgi:hypothetical protein
VICDLSPGDYNLNGHLPRGQYELIIQGAAAKFLLLEMKTKTQNIFTSYEFKFQISMSSYKKHIN